MKAPLAKPEQVCYTVCNQAQACRNLARALRPLPYRKRQTKACKPLNSLSCALCVGRAGSCQTAEYAPRDTRHELEVQAAELVSMVVDDRLE